MQMAKTTLKILVLGIAVTTGLSAMSSSMAQAAEPTFTAAEYSATFTGEGIQTIEYAAGHELELQNGDLHCESVHFEGNSINGPQQTISVTPTYSGCVFTAVSITLLVTIKHNGCKYVFQVEEEVEADTFTGSMSLSCPKGQGIEYLLYVNASKHALGEAFCKYKADPQKTTEIHYENITPGHISVTTNSFFMTTRTAGSPFSCGTAEVGAFYQGVTTIKTTGVFGQEINGDIG